MQHVMGHLVHVKSATHSPVRGQEREYGSTRQGPALPEAPFHQSPMSIVFGSDAFDIRTGKLEWSLYQVEQESKNGDHPSCSLVQNFLKLLA